MRHQAEVCGFFGEVWRRWGGELDPKRGIVTFQRSRSRYHDPDPPVAETASAIVARRQAFAEQWKAEHEAPLWVQLFDEILFPATSRSQ